MITNLAKFPVKAFATKLWPVAHHVISQNQSAFIKGRFILDGILSLYEIVHDLRARNSRAVILKLDLRRLMILLVGTSYVRCFWAKVLMGPWFTDLCSWSRVATLWFRSMGTSVSSSPMAGA